MQSMPITTNETRSGGFSDLPDFQQYLSYIVVVSFIGGGNHRPAVSH
jgi:hypothetical protein